MKFEKTLYTIRFLNVRLLLSGSFIVFVIQSIIFLNLSEIEIFFENFQHRPVSAILFLSIERRLVTTSQRSHSKTNAQTAQDLRKTLFLLCHAFTGLFAVRIFLLRNRAKIARRPQDVTEMTTGAFGNGSVLYPD